MAQYRSKVAYGLSDALITEAPFPIQALRAPTAGDIGYLPGTIWVDKPDSAIYILVSIVANQANWLLMEASGGAGVFTTLTSTSTSNIGVGAGNVTVNIATGSGNNPITIGGTGNNVIEVGSNQAGGSIDLGENMTTGSINIGGLVQTGAIFVGTGTGAQVISIGNGGGGVKTISIGNGAAANIVALGSTTGAAITTINGGTSGIILNAPFLELSTGVRIYSGNGAPGNPLAIDAGDLYVRLDPAGATSRLYIATGTGAWTNVTCAA
jgi:hypothetical protein